MKNLLDRSDLERLAQIVRDETGNQVQEKNFSMLSSRLQGRLIKLGLSSMQEYWHYFSAKEAEEREVLQGLMTTHYTFFFREYAHFETLAKWIDQEGARLKERYQADRQPVRVWSAACSRGHEVYSLAAFLSLQLTKKYGVPFEILGTDIDAESVNYAKNGVYPIKEVNTIPQIYLNGFWKRGTGNIKNFAAVHPNIRASVKFEPLNLLELTKWTNTASFDVVFCRNVFIYFSDANVRQIATNLVRRMQPRGLFVSGMSEPIRFEGWNYPIVGPSSYQLVSQAALNPPKAESEKATLVATPPPIAIMEKYRVLCVDDSPTIQTLMKAIFKNDPDCAGVDTAMNGNEARKKLNAEKYQLITLDIHMPECNGIEFLERHYNKASDPPVLMVSSVNRSDVDLATKALSLGAFDYVEKPAMNKIKESTQELLTKTKMALRKDAEASGVTDLDHEIKQKIIVPDASQCLRIVIADPASIAALEEIVRGQKSEQRSPPLLIFWSGGADLEGQMLNWTQNQIAVVRDFKQMLRPSRIYICREIPSPELLNDLKAKSASVQVVAKDMPILTGLAQRTHLQVLVDESVATKSADIEHRLSAKISDVTPATSFPSLSVEFFANLRKAG